MDDNGMPDDGQVTEQIDVPSSHDARGALGELPPQRMASSACWSTPSTTALEGRHELIYFVGRMS
jgi:hypothetical protein